MAYTPVPTAYDGAPGWTARFVNTYIRDNFAAGIPDIFVAKGDIAGATATNAAGRLAVGANNTLLTADSAQTTGLRWQVDPAIDAITAKGNILAGTAADTAQVVAIPTGGYNTDFFNGNVLYADSAESAGVRWGYPWAAAQMVATINQVVSQHTGSLKVSNFNYLMYSLGQQASTANDRFTATTTAKYLVVAYVYIADNTDHNAGRGWILRVYKNGSAHQVLDANLYTADPGTREMAYILDGITVVNLSAGDYIELYLERDVGATTLNCMINAAQLYITQHWSIQQLVVV
jgi:hypothetical protein